MVVQNLLLLLLSADDGAVRRRRRVGGARILGRPDVREQLAAGLAIALAMDGQRVRQAAHCESV